jgi:replicative DNA helicase
VNPDRALITRAVQVGGIEKAMGMGIEPHHFSDAHDIDDPKTCAHVWRWCLEYTRTYNASPSSLMLQEQFPEWRGEPVADPLEAVLDLFVRSVKRRVFIEEWRSLAPMADDPAQQGRLDELMHESARRIAQIMPSRRATFRSDMDKRIDEYEASVKAGIQPGIKFGIPDFDYLTEGAQGGDIIIVAGFSGAGKSTAGQWFLHNAVNQGKTALLFSLEMNAKSLWRRFDTMETNFSHMALKKGLLPPEDVKRWREAAVRVKKSKEEIIVLDKLGGCTVDRVYSEISRYKPDIACVDYIQLMKGSKAMGGGGTVQTWERVKTISNELKAIASETDTPIVVVAQSNRSAKDGGATMDNIGDSIAIVQDSDIFFGLMQDDDMRTEGRMRMRMVKCRDAPPGHTDLYWHPTTMTFGPWDDYQNNVFLRDQRKPLVPTGAKP